MNGNIGPICTAEDDCEGPGSVDYGGHGMASMMIAIDPGDGDGTRFHGVQPAECASRIWRLKPAKVLHACAIGISSFHSLKELEEQHG